MLFYVVTGVQFSEETLSFGFDHVLFQNTCVNSLFGKQVIPFSTH